MSINEQMGLNFGEKSEPKPETNVTPLQELLRKRLAGGPVSKEEQEVIDVIHEKESERALYEHRRK
jgi:hypothetical protein